MSGATAAGFDATSPPGRSGRPSADVSAALETHILDAAWKAALAYGADEFTLDQVAQVARASKRTIYARFRNKHEMVHRMVGRRVADFLEAVRGRPRGLAIERALELHAMGSMRYMTSAEGKVFARLTEAYSGMTPPGVETIQQASYRVACEGIQSILTDATARGEISVPDPRFAATFWLDSLTGHARLADPDVDDATLACWARCHTALFLRGVAACTGGKTAPAA